jgi:hypothetical protein
MVAYLALTSHWVSLNESSGCLILRAVLISFHRIKKKHSGTNIAKTILHLLYWANVTHKVYFFNVLTISIYSHIHIPSDWPLHTGQCQEQCSCYARAGVAASCMQDSHCGWLRYFEPLYLMLCTYNQHLLISHHCICDFNSQIIMMVTLTQTAMLESSNWMIAMMTQALNLILGWWASNTTPFDVLEGLFISYALLTSTGKASMHSSKMEMNAVGSPQRTTTADTLRFKYQSYSFSET